MPRWICSRYNYQSQLDDDLNELMDDLRSMLLRGRYILTPEVETFESAFSQYVGSQYCIGVNTGTDALLLALLAAGIRPGEEVITQANTFHATVAAIVLAGAIPVLVDADDRTFLISEPALRAAVTSQTRVILPVHLYGKPTPMQDLLAFAQPRSIHVIEDAAQAHGAEIHGKRAGSFGVAGCFSFHPSKNLAAAGDAGAIVTDDPGLAQSLRQIRALGQQGQNHHVTVGYNSKMDAIQARVLFQKLRHLDVWNNSRRRIASLYREVLQGLPISFQGDDDNEQHAYHLFQIRVAERDQLLQYLIERGVDAVVRYPVPIHLQPAFARWGWKAGQFPVAERLCRELLCLPIRPDMTESDVGFVGGAVRSFYLGEHSATVIEMAQGPAAIEHHNTACTISSSKIGM